MQVSFSTVLASGIMDSLLTVSLLKSMLDKGFEGARSNRSVRQPAECNAKANDQVSRVCVACYSLSLCTLCPIQHYTAKALESIYKIFTVRWFSSAFRSLLCAGLLAIYPVVVSEIFTKIVKWFENGEHMFSRKLVNPAVSIFHKCMDGFLKLRQILDRSPITVTLFSNRRQGFDSSVDTEFLFGREGAPWLEIFENTSHSL